MADAADSKSVARKGVWVRLPPPAPTSCDVFPSRILPTFAKGDESCENVFSIALNRFNMTPPIRSSSEVCKKEGPCFAALPS
jgi:hypothetical protein